jgi:hypothetical protein
MMRFLVLPVNSLVVSLFALSHVRRTSIQVDRMYFEKDTEPYAKQRDQEVFELCRSKGMCSLSLTPIKS